MSGDISKHFDKNNLHHAYLIEGAREEIIPEIHSFMQTLGISPSGNPDFVEIHIDNLKIDEALSLRSMADQKGFTSDKKVFIISANHFSLDAEQALLKMFEEPIENTHFFLIVPEIKALLPTLVSRFYTISNLEDHQEKLKDAKRFIAMTPSDRINFLKDFLIEGEENEEFKSKDSVRSKSLRFLNDLECSLHEKCQNNLSGTDYFNQIFQARKFLRQPGSSTKSLMESIALIIPNF